MDENPPYVDEADRDDIDLLLSLSLKVKGDCSDPKLIERAKRLKRDIDFITKHADPFADPSLVNDLLDTMEFAVGLYRRGRVLNRLK